MWAADEICHRHEILLTDWSDFIDSLSIRKGHLKKLGWIKWTGSQISLQFYLKKQHILKAWSDLLNSSTNTIFILGFYLLNELKINTIILLG